MYHFLTNSSFSNLSHSFIRQRSFIYLFEPSCVRKSNKNSQFWHFFPFANTFYTLYCECILTIVRNINTRNHVSLIQEYQRTFVKKEKIKKENEKVAKRKLGKVGNLGKVIPSFLSFLGFKNLGKKFPRFPSFLPDHKIHPVEKQNININE